MYSCIHGIEPIDKYAVDHFLKLCDVNMKQFRGLLNKPIENYNLFHIFNSLNRPINSLIDYIYSNTINPCVIVYTTTPYTSTFKIYNCVLDTFNVDLIHKFILPFIKYNYNINKYLAICFPLKSMYLSSILPVTYDYLSIICPHMTEYQVNVLKNKVTKYTTLFKYKSDCNQYLYISCSFTSTININRTIVVDLEEYKLNCKIEEHYTYKTMETAEYKVKEVSNGYSCVNQNEPTRQTNIYFLIIVFLWFVLNIVLINGIYNQIIVLFGIMVLFIFYKFKIK